MPTLVAMLPEDDWVLSKLIHDQCSPFLTALTEFSGRQAPNL
jgi:hypothetical protein